MIWITELTDTNIVFQFYERELPEHIPNGRKTKINHIEYPGGFQTNQIIGVYEKPIDWSGLFYGTYKINGVVVTAKGRAEEFKKLVGRPLRFGFPVPGMNKDNEIPGRTEVTSKSSDDYVAGDTGVYIIEDFEIEVKNYFHVEYKIKLIPHQKMEKVKPELTQSVKIKVDFNNVGTASANVKKAAGKSSHQAIRNANKPAASAQGLIGPPKPEVKKVHTKVDFYMR